MGALFRFNRLGGLQRFVRVLGLAAGLLVAQFSYATSIQYEAIHLASSPPGENLWQYRYYVSGFTEGTEWGFDIFFPLSLGYQFDDLQNPTAPNPGWDAVNYLVQADPNIPQDGFFEAVALVDMPSTLGIFGITFNWRNADVPGPGSQVFHIIDPSLAVTEFGNTTPYSASNVPLPAAGWLVAGTFPVLVRFVSRKRSSSV